MGRNKLPMQIKQLRGTNQPCRNFANISPASELPIPKGLKGNAKKIFIEKATQLYNMKIITPLDVDALIIYSTEMATVIKAQKIIEKDGHIILVRDDDNHIIGQQPNAWLKIRSDAIKNVNLIGQQFGFTPISRTKFVMPEVKPQDDFADFEEL